MHPTTVTRSTSLDAAPDAVWASLADGEGLSGWLAERVDLVVAPGAAGSAVDGSSVRRIVVTDIEVGRSVGFVWWDDARPAEVSTVTITVEPVTGDDGGSTVTVSERLIGAGAPSGALDAASVADVVAVDHAWDRRLHALVGERSLALTGASV